MGTGIDWSNLTEIPGLGKVESSISTNCRALIATTDGMLLIIRKKLGRSPDDSWSFPGLEIVSDHFAVMELGSYLRNTVGLLEAMVVMIGSITNSEAKSRIEGAPKGKHHVRNCFWLCYVPTTAAEVKAEPKTNDNIVECRFETIHTAIHKVLENPEEKGSISNDMCRIVSEWAKRVYAMKAFK